MSEVLTYLMTLPIIPPMRPRTLNVPAKQLFLPVLRCYIVRNTIGRELANLMLGSNHAMDLSISRDALTVWDPVWPY